MDNLPGFRMVQAAMRRYNGITNKEDRGMGMTKEEILVHVDHTLLKAVSAWDEIQTLCEEAIETIRLRSVSSKLCKTGIKSLWGQAECMHGHRISADIIPRRQRFTKPRRLWADGAGEVDMVVNLGDVKTANFQRSHVKSRQSKKQPVTMW